MSDVDAEKLIQVTLAKMEGHGWTTISFPYDLILDGEATRTWCAYTVGLEPEVVILGLPPTSAHRVMHQVADGAVLELWSTLEGTSIPEGTAWVLPVDPRWAEETMRVSTLVRGYVGAPPPQPVQIVFTDTDGRGPTDDGYLLIEYVLPVEESTRGD